jgi:hypothetical protein
MLEDKVWEPLAEVPEEGQWVGWGEMNHSPSPAGHHRSGDGQ